MLALLRKASIFGDRYIIARLFLSWHSYIGHYLGHPYLTALFLFVGTGKVCHYGWASLHNRPKLVQIGKVT